MNHHQPLAIEALREKIGADFATISDAARMLKLSVPQLERFLRATHHEHDIRRVEAGLESVGDLPLFIVRPGPNGSEVKLYSARPKSQWILRKNGDRA
jgi:hypothetical protein